MLLQEIKNLLKIKVGEGFNSPKVIFEHSQFRNEFFLEDELILMIGTNPSGNKQISISATEKTKIENILDKISGKN